MWRTETFTLGCKGWTQMQVSLLSSKWSAEGHVSRISADWCLASSPTPAHTLKTSSKVSVARTLPPEVAQPYLQELRAVLQLSQPQPEPPWLQEPVQSRDSLGWAAQRCWRDCSNGDVPSPAVKGGFILKAAITAQRHWSSLWQILRHGAVRLVIRHPNKTLVDPHADLPPQQINTDHYKITTKIAVPRLMFAITSGAVRGFKNITVQLERRGNDRQ